MESSPVLNLFLLLFLGATMVFAGFISYWMGVTGNVNRWMGFRTRATLSDVDVWVVINKKSGIALMVEGVGIVLISLVFRDLAVANYLTFIMLAMVVLISTVIKFVYDASKMAKRLSKPETPQ